MNFVKNSICVKGMVAFAVLLGAVSINMSAVAEAGVESRLRVESLLRYVLSAECLYNTSCRGEDEKNSFVNSIVNFLNNVECNDQNKMYVLEWRFKLAKVLALGDRTLSREAIEILLKEHWSCKYKIRFAHMKHEVRMCYDFITTFSAHFNLENMNGNEVDNQEFHSLLATLKKLIVQTKEHPTFSMLTILTNYCKECVSFLEMNLGEYHDVTCSFKRAFDIASNQKERFFLREFIDDKRKNLRSVAAQDRMRRGRKILLGITGICAGTYGLYRWYQGDRPKIVQSACSAVSYHAKKVWKRALSFWK
jgi:hypothetical protein